MQENNNQTEQTQPKTNNKNNLLIIIGIVVAVIIVILLIVFLVKPGNNGGTGGGGTNNPEVQKISLTGTKIVNDNILVKVDNTKSDTYDVVFELTVYNENNEVVRVFEETALAASPKKISYHVVNTTDVLEDNYTYDIKVKEEIKKDESYIYSDKMTQKSEIKDDVIEVEITNKTDDMIDSVQVAVVYYNAKEVVNYTNQFISNFYAASAMLETVYIPKDENGELIKFDNHEVIITAYNHQK